MKMCKAKIKPVITWSSLDEPVQVKAAGYDYFCKEDHGFQNKYQSFVLFEIRVYCNILTWRFESLTIFID